MKRLLPLIALLLLVALVASASCLLTRHYFGKTASAPASSSSKSEVFEQLNLSAEQERKIDSIRAQFAAQQHQCMLLMQQRNSELAAAILADRTDSPRVQAAVEKIHEAMGDMQKATLNSVFAAKEVLTPAQYDKLLQLTAQQLSAAADSPCCH